MTEHTTKGTTRRGFLGTSIAAGAAMGLVSGSAAHAASARHPNEVPKQMKILVLGGTGQTGPHFVRRAIAHGHEVTLFNRGNRSKDLFPDVECLIGDRYPEQGEGLKALEDEAKNGRTWDVVVDVWPSIPRLVSATAELLKENAQRYMFVSTISVYADHSIPDADETAEVLTAPNADDVEFTMALYGNFKAECENRVRENFPGERHAIFRPGLIVGQGDASYRGAYWPVRIREGGEVLAPGDGSDRIQLIDARDLVEFELHCIERAHHGTYNVVGPHPHHPLTMRRLLKTCRSTCGSDAKFTWVPADFLDEQQIGPWMQMPCWIPSEGEYAGFGTRNVDKAIAAGLTIRPLSETIEDTLQWVDGLPEETRASISQRAGISRETEQAALEAWASR